MAKYRVEIDYYDEEAEQDCTHSYAIECDSEEEAYESWSNGSYYGDDIIYDTVFNVRVEKIEEA